MNENTPKNKVLEPELLSPDDTDDFSYKNFMRAVFDPRVQQKNRELFGTVSWFLKARFGEQQTKEEQTNAIE